MAYAFLEISYTLVAVLLLWYFLTTSQKASTSFLNLWKHWSLFGFLFNLYSFGWLYTVYPLSWLPEGLLQIAGITLLHLVLSSVSGFCFGTMALLYFVKVKPQLLPAAFATALTISEILRSLAISLIYYGEGSTLALHFTAGTLGNALSFTPFIEYAYIGGVFNLTFILGYIIYIISSRENLKTYARHSYVLLFTLAGIHFLAPVQAPNSDITVGVVQTNFPTYANGGTKEDYTNQALKITELTNSFENKNIDIIVYPEDTRYLSSLSEEMRSGISKKFKETLLVDGDSSRLNNQLINVSIFYNQENDVRLQRGKELLLPFNEYIPYFFSSLFLLFLPEETLQNYKNLHTYLPVHSKKSIQYKKEKISTLICSEILSFSVINNLRKEKPAIIFFQSRLGVFHNNPIFIMHLRSFTKIAAAQTRTTLISATNDSVSHIISPYGKIILMQGVGFSTSTYTVLKNSQELGLWVR